MAWLNHVSSVIESGELHDIPVTWSGFNSHAQNDTDIKPRAVIGICPLFPDKAASASMMKHAMES